ncbi:undecaprenyl-phosphate glucose phosphotransferase [Propylenella binzhouense]|uniref:Undecaprenyl-phosphate glucose phosphotransferase n=1 Tax=Propylenella binzhouense TaxID=2555902 RepID=A0A964WU49_9HYPH|nr:undecaprenyl-phosphate glucose phosphotransferase [Propylenella binzhouense]MYZ48485.1 undecaprenyl-phosphate glucose phosphotransferase [Propylenella binzhouense]
MSDITIDPTAVASSGAALAPKPPAGGVDTLSAAAINAARALSPRKVSPVLLGALARLADFGSLAALGAAILWLYVAGTDDVGLRYFAALALVPLATVILVGSFGGYSFGAYRRPVVQVGRTAGLWAAVFGCFTLVLFFLKMGEDFSRIWLATWFASGFLILTANRVGFTRLVHGWIRAGILERRAVLVGGGPEGVELLRALTAEKDNDIRICGIFDDRDETRVPAARLGYPLLGRIDELVEFGRQADIDLLIVALPLTAERRLVELLRTLWVLPVDIRLSAQSNQLRFRPRSYSFIGAVPFLDVFDRPIADWDAVVKRTFDIVIASLALVALSPLLLAAMAAVKLESSGPVFFRQRRYGFNNEVIEVLKLRSMYHERADLEARKAVTRGDPRVTRVGRIIRKFSIDELPQLINVLRGDLSLVGPRPHAVGHNELWKEVVDGYFARHRVKPGLTGWAQVHGWRGEVDSEEKIRHRVEHDLYYIENWSVFLDLYILLLTPLKLIAAENAY